MESQIVYMESMELWAIITKMFGEFDCGNELTEGRRRAVSLLMSNSRQSASILPGSAAERMKYPENISIDSRSYF